MRLPWNPKTTNIQKAKAWASEDGPNFFVFLAIWPIVLLLRLYRGLVGGTLTWSNFLWYLILWGAVSFLAVWHQIISQGFPKSIAGWLDLAVSTWPSIGALIALHVAQFFIKRSTKDKSRSRLEQERSLALARVNASLIELCQVSDRVRDQARRNLTLRDILETIDHEVRLSIDLEKPKGFFGVTLIVYGERRDILSVRARSSGGATADGLDAAQSVGHYATQAGKPKAIHWLGGSDIFPDRSLSNRSRRARYDSILAIPLPGLEPIGFITIDSARPFEFWGNRPNSLETILQPHSAMISFVLSGEAV